MLRSFPDAAAPRPFVVLALPRSRTRWLAEFLSYGPWRCTHEEARHFRSMEDVASWAKQAWCGSVETAVASFWRSIPKGVRVVVVRRPIPEVEASLRRVMSSPPSNLSSVLTHLDGKLEQLTRRVPGVIEVAYSALDTPQGASRIFEHALQLPFDSAWWEKLRGVNIQEPYVTFERYAAAYGPQLRRMAGLAKGAMLQGLARREVPTDAALTFQEEPFATFLRDATKLFASHATQVGEVPDAWRDKNLSLLREIAAAGGLVVLTARSNGRMFGYLMTELTPSREAPGRVSAVETTFFASPSWPGLGMKLQRENLARLRQRGVAEVWFRDGTRGDGGRMGTMFRRVGAAPAGALWRLDLSQEGT